MADSHGHAHDHDDDHDDHAHDAPEEDVVRTPLWLPFVGLGLLMLGAIGSYLWIYPGTMSASSADSANASDGGVEAAAAPQAVVVPPANPPAP